MLSALGLPASPLIAAEPAKQTDKSEVQAAVDAPSDTVNVEISGVDGQLLGNVRGRLSIYAFHDKLAPSKPRLRFLARQGESEAKKALQPLGYFRPTVSSSLENKNGQWKVKYEIDAGERIRLREADIKLTGAGKEDSEFKTALADHAFKSGDPLDQQRYEALKKRLQVIASERGFFDARLSSNEILVDPAKYEASIKLHFETGERYRLGDVDFQEERFWLKPGLLARYNDIEPGQWYESSDLQQLQSDLSNSEYYKQVEIVASPEEADSERQIPIQVRLQPNKRRRYTYGVGYGTDTGARVKAGVVGRRVNRHGHHFSAEAIVAQILYGIAGEYVIPGKDPRSDAWGLRGSFETEDSDNRQYTAYNIGGYFRYRDGLWVKTYALDYHVEKFELDDSEPISTLLIPSVDWSRTFPAELEKRIYAESGTWLQMRVKGGADALLSDTNFVQPFVAAKWIHSFKNTHRVIARGALGSTWVDDFGELPSSLRFYTGGDRTVRGYEYNLIAPTGSDNDPLGGKHLSEASLEYEIPFAPKWSYAVFYDVGDAFDDEPDYKEGVGLGLRWKSPIGPVRIDLGHGLDQPLGDDIRFHLTIGPDL